MSPTLRAAKPCKSVVLPICPAIPAGMTGHNHRFGSNLSSIPPVVLRCPGISKNIANQALRSLGRARCTLTGVLLYA